MKTRLAQVVGVLALVAMAGTAGAGDRHGTTPGKPVRLAAATMIVEVDATAGDAGVQFFLDGEPWRSMAISGPNGRTLLEIDAEGRLKNWGLTELFSESNEPPFSEVPLEELKRRFPEGRYTFSGTTVEGDELVGRARLSHDIPDGPEITSPADGEKVARKGVVARWNGPPEPRGIEIVGYRVIVTREDPLRVYSVDPSGRRQKGADSGGIPRARHRVRTRDPGDRGEREPDLHDDLLRRALALLRPVEIGQECSKQVVEGAPVGRRQGAQEALLVGHVGLEGVVDDRLPVRGQPDEDAPPVGRIRSALDQARLDEAVEALGHPARREQGRAHQLGRVELVGRPGAAQSRQQVEPARLEPVLGESCRERCVRERRRPVEPADEAQRGRVHVRSLAPPLLEDAVDVVGTLGSHVQRIAFLIDSFHEGYLRRKRVSMTTVPASMNAIRLHPPGGLDRLVDERIDTPSPGPGEALVHVHAAAITRDELDWPADRLPAIPSYELSGVVAATAPDVNDLPSETPSTRSPTSSATVPPPSTRSSPRRCSLPSRRRSTTSRAPRSHSRR